MTIFFTSVQQLWRSVPVQAPRDWTEVWKVIDILFKSRLGWSVHYTRVHVKRLKTLEISFSLRKLSSLINYIICFFFCLHPLKILTSRWCKLRMEKKKWFCFFLLNSKGSQIISVNFILYAWVFKRIGPFLFSTNYFIFRHWKTNSNIM